MKKNYKIEFGQRLKKERKLRKLTQEQMAEKLDISLKHYGAVERGLTGLSTENLIYLSDILGLSLDYLLKGESSAENSPLNEVNQLKKIVFTGSIVFCCSMIFNVAVLFFILS